MIFCCALSHSHLSNTVRRAEIVWRVWRGGKEDEILRRMSTSFAIIGNCFPINKLCKEGFCSYLPGIRHSSYPPTQCLRLQRACYLHAFTLSLIDQNPGGPQRTTIVLNLRPGRTRGIEGPGLRFSLCLGEGEGKGAGGGEIVSEGNFDNGMGAFHCMYTFPRPSLGVGVSNRVLHRPRDGEWSSMQIRIIVVLRLC